MMILITFICLLVYFIVCFSSRPAALFPWFSLWALLISFLFWFLCLVILFVSLLCLLFDVFHWFLCLALDSVYVKRSMPPSVFVITLIENCQNQDDIDRFFCNYFKYAPFLAFWFFFLGHLVYFWHEWWFDFFSGGG